MSAPGDRYWAVDLPGLSAEQADDIVRGAVRLGIAGTAVDPLRWLTRHFDVDTVDALLRRLTSSPPEPGDDLILTSLAEDIVGWREQAQTE